MRLKCLIYSVDFEEIEMLQHEDRWEELTNKVIDNLAKKGAKGVILGCTKIPLLIK